MKEPKLIWKLLFVLSASVHIVSSVSQKVELPLTLNCDNEFECTPTEFNSPFPSGRQYVYSYSLKSMIKVGLVLGNEQGTNKIVTENGSLIISPINSCQFLASLEPDELFDKQTASIKMTFYNGSVRDVCSSQENPAQREMNTLKSILSILLPRGISSSDIDLDGGIVLENGSRGLCLTKYIQCTNDRLIKYQSTSHCATKDEEAELRDNIFLKAKDFQEMISKVSEEAHGICDSSPLYVETQDIPKGLVICSVEKRNEIIHSSTCAESLEVDKHTPSLLRGVFYNRVDLKLREVLTKETSEIDSNPHFFKTSIAQVIERKPRKEQDAFLMKTFLDALKNIANSTKSQTEIQKSINIARSSIKYSAGYENIIRAFNELNISSSSSRTAKIILMVLAADANDENVMKIIETVLTNEDSLISKLSQPDKEDVLLKILTTSSSSHALPTLALLNFSQFLLDYISNSSRAFSDNSKLKALIAYSTQLNRFCNKMELLTGEKYCMKMSLIEQSPVMKIVRDGEAAHEKFMGLEALSNFQHHQYNVTICSKLYESRMGSSASLWSVLNCYRMRPCNEEGKQSHRNLIQDEAATSSVKIAVFLAMQRCFDKVDQDVIKNLFKMPSKNTELLTFIKGYRANRKLNGLADPLLDFQDDSHVTTTTVLDEDKSSKISTASNTLAVLSLPAIDMKLHFETNMLYFDKPSSVPELITLKLSANQRNNNRIILEAEIFVDDLRNTEMSKPALDFKITIIIRKFGTTFYIKEVMLQENMMQLLYTLQNAMRNPFRNHQASTLVQQKLRHFIMEIMNVEILDLQSLLQGTTFFPTITGIPYELSWDINSLTTLLLTKNNCTALFIDDDSSSYCNLAINPEFSLNGHLSVGFGFESEERAVLQGNLSAAYPIRIDMIRRVNDGEPKEETIKLTVPSLDSAIGRFKADFQGFLENGSDERKQWTYGLGFKGVLDNKYTLNEENIPPMEIHLIKSTKTPNNHKAKVKIIDAKFEGSLEQNLDYIRGNLTLHPDSSLKKDYALLIGFQNTEGFKRLEGMLINDGLEYSFNTYYMRYVRNQDPNKHHGVFSCGNQRGTGILCFWPFCEFCGTEYYIGAKVNTPQFKNVKLFEIEVTQEFPRKSINFIATSEGIPILGKTEFRASLSHGNDTLLINNNRIRSKINEKLENILPPHHDASGDALPESASTQRSLPTTILSLDTSFFTELLGQSGASFTYLSYPAYERFSYESRLLCGEIQYPSGNKGQQEHISYLSTWIYSQQLKSNNVPAGFTSDISIRSSQFPIINFDWNSRHKNLESFVQKTVMILRPVNLIRGEFKLEVINYGTQDRNHDVNLWSMLSWENMYLNQTYKVYLPDPSTLKILKGKIILERVDSILHTAGVEVFFGVDSALELKYDFHPENNNLLEILTSVTTAGETYGLFHHIEPSAQSGNNLHEGTEAQENNDSHSHKYTGTYVLGERSWKALGTFETSTGREMLPFSKFSIRLNSVEGQEMGIRVFGSETVQREKVHNITMGVTLGNTSFLEFVSEINPFDQIPIKANLFVKHYGEVKVSDSSKLANKRNFHVKARWFPHKKVIQGKIAFPTSLDVSPLYLDFDAAVAEENDMEIFLIKLKSGSTISISKNFSVTTNNVIQLRDLKWETGLQGLYAKESVHGFDEYDMWISKGFDILSFSIYYIRPDSERYAFQILKHHSSDQSGGAHCKYNFKMHRPNVTPFHVSADIEMKKVYNEMDKWEGQKIKFDESTNINETFQLIACHKDNFLYIFPMLNFDFNVIGQREFIWQDASYSDGRQLTDVVGKLVCLSKGASNLPFCNLLNLTYTFDSKYHENFDEPWLANAELINRVDSSSDALSIKLTTIYELVRRVFNNTSNMEDENILEMFLKTTREGKVFRNIYNLEYDLQRKENSLNSLEGHPFGVRGTYIFTKMYESWDFFEFTDNHKWNSINCGDFHVWTNLVNHTSDANSELAAFSSQYVSLGESNVIYSNENTTKNITWMELRSTLSTNGFGTLKSLIQQPALILNCYEGNVEADFLVRTEFSPVKALRMMISHEHSKIENEEDESLKFDAFTKLNTMLNDIELSGDNSFTILMGKLLGLGNSFTGRFGSEESNYEYATFKAFAVLPSYNEIERDNLIHFDISSSVTTADDDEVELRIVNDIIYTLPLNQLPLIRFSLVENSTDFNLERNFSILAYQNSAKENVPKSGFVSRLPINIISDNLNELSLTQISIQSVTQQIVDDYYNVTCLNEESATENEFDSSGQIWSDYNFELLSKYNFHANLANIIMRTRLLGIEEKVFHCQSLINVCYDNGTNATDVQADVSNYCNLVLLPAKQAMYLLL